MWGCGGGKSLAGRDGGRGGGEPVTLRSYTGSGGQQRVVGFFFFLFLFSVRERTADFSDDPGQGKTQ